MELPPPDFALRSVAVAGGELAGGTLAECALPEHARHPAFSRSNDRARTAPWIHGAATVLKPGDDLVILGPTAAVEALAAGGSTPRPRAATELAEDGSESPGGPGGEAARAAGIRLYNGYGFVSSFEYVLLPGC